MRKTLFACVLGVFVGYYLHGHPESPLPSAEGHKWAEEFPVELYRCHEVHFESGKTWIDIVDYVPLSVSNEELLDYAYQVFYKDSENGNKEYELRHKGKVIARMGHSEVLLGDRYRIVYDETGPHKLYMEDSPAKVLARGAQLVGSGKVFVSVDELGEAWRTGIVK